jgi:hypothetical protein
MVDDPTFYPIALIAVLIIGVSKSGFGSGLGILGVPLMSLVIPPIQAAGIMLPLLCVMDLFNVWHYRFTWDATNLRILLPAGLLGILLGTFTFRYLPETLIRIFVGLIAMLFAANHFLGRTEKSQRAPDRLRGGFWGAVAGFTSFGVHAGGPPVSMYLLPLRLEKSLFVGTSVLFFSVVNYVKLIPYYFLGQLNIGNLITSLLLSPLVPLGFWLGIKLHKRVDERLFYNLAYTFLLLTGLKLLYDGFTSLSRAGM